MARVTVLPGVGEDIDRILDHLDRYDAVDGPARILEIMQAIAVLEHNPLIGRPVNDKRELVIGRITHGYVALYHYVVEIDRVFVLALRSQREKGYADR